MPSKHARVCSCHFREGKKLNGPEMFEWNKDKLFAEQRRTPRKKKKTVSTEKTLAELVEQAKRINHHLLRKRINKGQKEC